MQLRVLLFSTLLFSAPLLFSPPSSLSTLLSLLPPQTLDQRVCAHSFLDDAVKKRRKAESTHGMLPSREGNSSTTTGDYAGGSATANATLLQTPALASESSYGISGTTTAVAAAAAVVITKAVTGKVEPSNSLAMLGEYSSEDD